MKILFRSLFAAVLLVLATACEKPVQIMLTVSQSEIELPATGGSETVTVECGQEWDFECEASWVKVTRSSQSLIIHVDSNIAPAGSASMGRSATIVVTSGTKTCPIRVSQSEEEFFFSVLGVSAPEVFPSSGGRLQVRVGHNTDYTASVPEDVDWISAVSTKSETYEYVYFQIEQNRGESRSADIIFRSQGGNVNMSVSQEGYVVPNLIKTADDLAGFITNVGKLQPGVTYKLANDIDLRGTKLPVLAKTDTLKNDLDGQGFYIKNWTTDSPMFLNSKARISNVVIDSSCKMQFSGDGVSDRLFAFLVGNNFGLVKDCVNRGSINVKNSASATIYVAGLVARQDELPIGVVEGCTNNGNIYVEASVSASCSAIAGVVGYIGHSSCAGKVLVKDCGNTGNIEFLFNGAAKAMSKFGIGGVVGQTRTNAADEANGIETSNNGTIDGCSNSGNLKWTYTEGGSGAYPSMGGVAGIVEGEIRNCLNHGSLTYIGNPTVAVTNANIGGVAGYVTYNAFNCKNYGSISTTGAFAGGTRYAQSGGNCAYSCIGGVFGEVGPYLWAANPVNCPVKAESCYNYADLVLTPNMASSGGPTFAIGGVVGFASAKLIGCGNNGSLKLTANPKTLYLGGVTGATTATVEDCFNKKEIIFDGMESNAAAYEAVFFGGIAGIMLQTKCQIISNTNEGELRIVRGVHTPSAWSYLGGIVGGYSGYYSHTMKDCKSWGNVINDSELCVVMGGAAGCFNGNLSSCRVENINITNNSTIGETGRPVDMGGLAGYANSDPVSSNRISNVNLSTANPVTYMAAFLGAIEKCKTNCSENELSNVSLVNTSGGTPWIGVLIGRYRIADLAASGYYLNWTNGTIDKALTDAWPMAGFLNGGTVNY